MASTLVALQTVTVGAGGAATVTFSSIPQTYNDLVVKYSLRNDTNTTLTKITLNGDASTSNYFQRRAYGDGSTVASDASTNLGYFSPIGSGQSGATSSTFSNGELYIPNYTSSNNKSGSFDSSVENNAVAGFNTFTAGLWNITSAVTSITFTASSNWVEYSTFTLYGVYNSPLDTAVEAPTIGTATAASTGANVAFTPSGTGAPATSYVATSSPGGISATGTTSPILVTGLTSGTAYTFTVKGQNPGGTGAASAASNSVTPYDGYESIATLYPTGTSAVFSSIPSGYTHLQIRSFVRTNRAGSANDSIWMQFNTDTGANYTYHQLYGEGTTALAGGVANENQTQINYAPAATSTANTYSVGVVDILDYSNTNKYKTQRNLSGYDANGSGFILLRSGVWMSTAAISTITMYSANAASFVAGTVFELYGIR